VSLSFSTPTYADDHRPRRDDDQHDPRHGDLSEHRIQPRKTELIAVIDLRAVEALCRGDKAGLVVLHDRYHASMVRLARRYVPDQAAAEEVAQDTWLEVLRGIGRFEARCAPKTWVFRILTNRAKTRGTRDRRCVPFSALDGQGEGASESGGDVDRFSRGGHWSSQPASPDDRPEERLLSAETRTRILAAVAALPPAQRNVITLRDIKGWGANEVCAALGISAANQRVLLHRARVKVRHALEQYLEDAVDRVG